MQRFSKLYQCLDQTNSTNAKVEAMVDYFGRVDPADGAWAVYFLSGRRLKRLVGHANLRQWLVEVSGLPAWLVEDSYSNVGDLAETVALLLGDTSGGAPDDRTLDSWVRDELLPLREASVDEQAERIKGWWRSLDYEGSYVVTKLLTGALRVGVSQLLVARALAQCAGLPRPTVLHRMMGDWEPSAAFYEQLLNPDDGETIRSRPYPFFLASPLDGDPESNAFGEVGDWQLEWKWDGIRGQLIRREGETYLWSRGEELITGRFPEIEAAAESLSADCVLDGELLAWRDGQPLPFNELQRRIGRKKVGKKLLADVPVSFIAYDLLEKDGIDLRSRTLRERRAELTRLLDDADERIRVSETIDVADWASAAERRDEARQRGVEGLMLKRFESPYRTGRKRGDWWKWKVEPYTVDAIMIYAQAGHGRRSNLYTDYTFAVWNDDELVPIAKAYSGLDNGEIQELDRWIRRNTRERFGPVRAVEPEQVFELAFEGINRSARHKSGIAVRFPRIARWRRDLGPDGADSLDSVQRLVDRNE